MKPKSPLTDAAIRTAIVSGAIVPPPGEGKSPGLNAMALVAWAIALLGTAALVVAYLMH